MVRAARTLLVRIDSLSEVDGMPVKIGVNASARQLSSPDFGKSCERVLSETNLTPSLLGLEITEGLLLQDSAKILDQLAQLKKLGVKIAMDDFGTGYSSLSYLWRFPFDKIKIDRSFVAEMQDNAAIADILRTIALLGQTLNLEVTAEGVENGAVARRLRELGCEYAQGYYFGRPVPRDQLLFVSGSPRRTAAPPPERDRATDAPSHGPR